MPPPTIPELKEEIYNILKTPGPHHYLVLADKLNVSNSQIIYNILYQDRRLERVPNQPGQFRIILQGTKTEQADKAQRQATKSVRMKPKTSKEILKNVWEPGSPYIDKPRKIIKKTIIEYRCPYCNGLLEISTEAKK